MIHVNDTDVKFTSTDFQRFQNSGMSPSSSPAQYLSHGLKPANWTSKPLTYLQRQFRADDIRKGSTGLEKRAPRGKYFVFHFNRHATRADRLSVCLSATPTFQRFFPGRGYTCIFICYGATGVKYGSHVSGATARSSRQDFRTPNFLEIAVLLQMLRVSIFMYAFCQLEKRWFI